MVETIALKTRSGFTFTTDVAGPAGGALVLLLHGFPESRHSWRAALPALATAGYRAVAPDQRGYSPGARPDPRDLANYAFDKLIADAIDIADVAGAQGKRFHLVGHDWGGQVSWGVADKHADRLASLAILSRPHPSSFRRALLKEDGDQKHRSRHHRKFLEPATGPMLLEALRTVNHISSAGGLLTSFVAFDRLSERRLWFRPRGDAKGRRRGSEHAPQDTAPMRA